MPDTKTKVRGKCPVWLLEYPDAVALFKVALKACRSPRYS